MANWSQPLSRTIRTSDGKTFRTLAEAGTFVVHEDHVGMHWRSVARALLIAALEPAAIEGATAAVERALAREGLLDSRKTAPGSRQPIYNER